MATAAPEVFDQFYSFPPFFTLQPTPPTRTRQLEMWTKLLHSQCALSRQFVLTRSEPVYNNKEIKRSLNDDFITELFSYLIDNDHGIPASGSGGTSSPSRAAAHGKRVGVPQQPSGTGVDSVIVWFIPKEKWHEKIYDYAKRNGLINGGIATTFEILQDDEFRGMDTRVLGVLLRGMQEARKCEVMLANSGDIDGVKFF